MADRTLTQLLTDVGSLLVDAGLVVDPTRRQAAVRDGLCWVVLDSDVRGGIDRVRLQTNGVVTEGKDLPGLLTTMLAALEGSGGWVVPVDWQCYYKVTPLVDKNKVVDHVIIGCATNERSM